jgi:hypothetical protein
VVFGFDFTFACVDTAMPSASEDRFRQSWKVQELSGKPAQAWLVVRRVVATLIALGLIGVCGWLIFSLFWVPKSYLAYWSANVYQPLSASPVKYASSDFAAIESLKDDFAGTNLINPAETKLTKEALETNLRELANMGMRSKDACIVFVTAHGGVRNKEAFLLCEPGDRNSELQLADLLAALKNVEAGTKLLILDAGRDELAEGATGVGDDTFAALLEKAVNEADDPALWVLTANAPLERSHVSADWNRPVFGYMVSQGLRGGADRNRDGVIQLDELFNFVQSGVASWVKLATAAAESQTPQLIHFEYGKPSTEQVASRRLMRAKAGAAEPEPAIEHVAESEMEEQRSGISKWLAERGEEAKERFSIKDDIHIFSHMLGIHGHEGHEGGEAHGEHAAGGGHAATEGEHNAEAHDAKADARAETAAAARKQVKDFWLAAARLEAADNQMPPSVVAPPLWRDLRERLLWCDQFCASGIPAEAKTPWTQVSKELLGIDQSLQAFAAYRMPPLVDAPAGQPISLAMADRLAGGEAKNRLPKPLIDFLTQYDRLLLEEPPATFKEKLNGILAGQKADLGFANYFELQLLAPGRELNKDPDIPSAMLQLLLKARRIGESIAANPLCGDGWMRDAIEAADRSRSEGERQLFDRTSSNWENQTTDRLTAAMEGYESALRNLAFVGETIQYRNGLLLNARGLVQRARLNGSDDKEVAAVEKVFSTLQDLNKALADPSKTNIDALKRARDQVETASTALERKTDPANDAWRITNVLATMLPAPEARTKLAGELVAAAKHQMADFKLPESESEATNLAAATDDQWKRAVREFGLQLELARLAGYDDAALAKLNKSLAAAPAGQIEKLTEARGQLAELLDNVPAAIARISTASANDGARDATLLRSTVPQWLLLGADLRDRIDPKNNLITRLNQVTWHDLLAWNSKRFRGAADDAPVANGPLLARLATTLHDLANLVPEQPAIPPFSQPVLAIEAPDQVSLVEFGEGTVSFQVKSNASEEKPVWLTAQYNEKWLAVDPSIYHQQELPAALAGKNLDEKASHLPLRPDRLGLASTDRIPAGGARDYTVKIRRQPNNDAGGAAKLILKAVSGDTFVRREVAVDLPGREALDVTVNAPPEFWTAATRSLHPLPNRIQNFTFDVVNRAKVAKKLDVSIVAPSNVPNKAELVGLPTGAQKADVATKLLDPYGPLVPLGPVFPIDLPPSGESVRVKLGAADAKLNPKANLLLPEKGDPEQFAGIPLRYGLMLLLTDPATKEVTIRRIEITPQRPAGYLDAVAHYNRATERLDIIVSAKNRDVIPPDGLQISADVTGVSAQLQRSLKGVLKAPDFTATMYAHLAPTALPEVTANVNVDDYPRAFVFRFSRSTAPRDLTPTTDLAEVRIASPAEGKAYKAPVKGIDVVAEVDAPAGTFSEGDTTSNVEFGIDENQDRELQGERVEIRNADRQVSVYAKSLLPDGSLGLNTRVGDFHLTLSTGLADGRASVLGRLIVGGRPTWSKPVEILLDGSPPTIHAAMPPNRQAEADDDLVVRVLTHQTVNEVDLSGVKKVEAVFDSVASKGTVDAKPAAWEEGVPDGPNAWIVKLPTKGMGLGPQTVLVRATDNVGNVSDPLREPVTIVPKKPKEAAVAPKPPPKPDVANVVTGKVQYGDDAVKANVSLESFVGPQVPAVVSDASGKFTFPKVPPGKYTLKAKTPEAIHNRFRTAEMEVTVEPKPKVQPPVSVKLQ